MLNLGVIRPSSSPYSSPETLQPKKDGSIRFCFVKDSCPIPNIQEIVDMLKGAKISTLDLRSGYWQVDMAEQAIPKQPLELTGGSMNLYVSPLV